MSLSSVGLPFSADAQLDRSSFVERVPQTVYARRWSLGPTPEVAQQATLPPMLPEAHLHALSFNEYGPFQKYLWGPSLDLDENVRSRTQPPCPLPMVPSDPNPPVAPAFTSFFSNLAHRPAISQFPSQNSILDTSATAPILSPEHISWSRRSSNDTMLPHHRPDY